MDEEQQTKMTLRDLFASSVIGELVQRRGFSDHSMGINVDTARTAYLIADAMIIARGEKEAE